MVLAFVGVFIGLAAGACLGVYIGTFFLQKYFEYKDVKHLDIVSDYNEDIPVPDLEGKPVPARFRSFIKYFPNWVTMPDFYRVTWMNHVLKNLWPYYNQAIGKMVLETAEPQIADMKKQYPFIEAIDIELIDFGTKPMRVGGIKVYVSSDDEVIMECPLSWGSNARVRASLRLRVSKWSFYIPVEVSNIQMKASSRITLKPLVDTLPCMGAVNLTLIDTPYFDFELHLFRKFDWMLLPGLNQLVVWLLNGVVGDMLQYPNNMTFDIMEGGGVPPPPIGLLQIKIIRVDKITAGGDLLSKVDPYIEVGVRERTQRTKTEWNKKNPVFNEVFNLIVDDPDIQQLTFRMHDDDMGFNDPVIGIIEQNLADQKFIKKPKVRIPLTLDFISPPALKKMKRLVKKNTERNMKSQNLVEAGVDEHGHKQYKIPDPPKEEQEQVNEAGRKHKVGTLHFEAIYIPFKGVKRANEDDELERHEDQPEHKHTKKTNLSNITEEDKGILTVTLTGCKNLEAPDGTVDPYVELLLNDPVKVRPEIQKSMAMTNEPSPHWNQKFDFAMVSATSTLDLKVYDKKTTAQNVIHSVTHPVSTISNKISGKSDKRDELIGSLKLKIKDVVRNEKIRDSWALQQTQKGDIQLTLQWHSINLDVGDDALDEPGDQKENEAFHKKLEEEKRRNEGNETPSKKHHHFLPSKVRERKSHEKTREPDSGEPKSPVNGAGAPTSGIVTPTDTSFSQQSQASDSSSKQKYPKAKREKVQYE